MTSHEDFPMCLINNCDRPSRTRVPGLCNAHRQRRQIYGDPTFHPQPQSTLTARMLAKVERASDENCWPYLGATQNGYGAISDGRKALKAHRVAYEIWVGRIPDGMTVDHECHNEALASGACSPGPCAHRACCNPAHLILRTTGENTLRGGSLSAINARKTHCTEGHLLSESRVCTICRDAASARWRKSGVVVDCPQCGKTMKRVSLPTHRKKHCKGSPMIVARDGD